MRARELGITIGTGWPGPGNAITDVAGVRVGHQHPQRRGGARRPDRGPAGPRPRSEEAFVNAMVAAETMTGRGAVTAHRFGPDRLLGIMDCYRPRPPGSRRRLGEAAAATPEQQRTQPQ
jgi:hypothetical protein